jgi:hypothetical protein
MLMAMNKAKRCRHIGAAVIALMLSSNFALAQTTSTQAIQSNEQEKSAAVDSLASWTAIFQNAAEQWTSANITSDAWNVSSSTTPNSFGTYLPILLYAGNASALCGAPANTSQSVNLITAGYLPPNFAASYSGEYCAMVYPDSGTATVSTLSVSGSTGGTDLGPVSTVLAYFVAGSATDNENLLKNSPDQYVVAHLAPLLAKNYAAGGNAMKYIPGITSQGSANSSWTSVQP